MTAEQFLKEQGWRPADPHVFPKAQTEAYWENPGTDGERFMRQDRAIKYILERPPFEVIR